MSEPMATREKAAFVCEGRHPARPVHAADVIGIKGVVSKQLRGEQRLSFNFSWEILGALAIKNCLRHERILERRSVTNFNSQKMSWRLG
jgi:hypothetical protein